MVASSSLSLQDLVNMWTIRQQSTALLSPKCCYDRCSRKHQGSKEETQNNSNDDTDLHLKCCANCGAAAYCSRICQTNDWPQHKILCKTILSQYKSRIKQLKTPQQKEALTRLSLSAPPVHEEYTNKFGVHPIIAFAIQEARELVLQRSRLNIPDTLHGSDTHNPDQLLWRWQEVSPALGRFLTTSQNGDIFEEKQYLPYAPHGVQQFRNTPLFSTSLFKNGVTMIDIGFVDLGIVFDSLSCLDENGPPLEIIGIDCEPFAVAKALVLSEMAKHPDAKARSIVEVWLSSLWTQETYKAFVVAIKTVLERDTDSDASSKRLDDRVKQILRFWKKHPKISRQKSLAFHIRRTSVAPAIRFCTRACNLAREGDRADYLRCHFTKAFYEDDSTTVGSPIMSTTSETLGIKQMSEDVFEAVPYSVHIWSNPDFDHEQSLLERTRGYFESQMLRYIKLVQNGTILFSPRVGELSPTNHALVQELAELNPYLVSWSNVVDYIPPKEFHQMARKISGEDTMHYFHSLNWCTRVNGIDVYDIHEAGRMQTFTLGLMHLEHARLLLGGFVRPQGPFHFRNICSPILARFHINAFLRYFFAGQDVNCGNFVSDGSPFLPHNPLSRTETTAFLVFAYKDSGITFPHSSYDYMRDLE